MKGDFTRATFRGRNHYRSVLLQQGRVQLDADWNEQVDIWSHLTGLTTVDTVGPHGGPLHGAGMAITDPSGDPPAGTVGTDLRVSAGRYYVHGVLCENEEPVPLAAQPDLPGVRLLTTAGRYVAFLDVWQEHVTAVERPALREVALGGPDTATRSRTIWQVRLAGPLAPKTSCANVAPPWVPPGSASTGRLRARAQAATASPDPCVIPTTAGYRRLENQLYRVEILDGSTAAGGPTYVWSRDNGSVVARLDKIDGNTLTIDAPGRDERLGFAKDDWVEVIDVDRVRRGEPGFLGRLGDVEGTKLPVAQWRGGVTPSGLGEVTVVRRWDSDGATAVAAGWVALEDGVEIEFEAGGVLHTGDFWLIPARTANLQGEQVDPDLAGNVDWPRAAHEPHDPLFEPRAGVEHRFAAVALLDLASSGTWTLASDCRRLFPPLTELTDVEYAGGDGQEAMPGDPLPQPLAVSVSNDTEPVPGARVRFTAADTDGRLAATETDLAASTVSEIEAVTDARGIASCFWRPARDVGRPSQRVTAVLLGPDGAGLGAPVLFAASLSIAAEVSYDPGSCAALAGARTVQDALDHLVGAQSLVPVGGDGQDGRPGTDLPLPVQVLVRSDCGPVTRAIVRFTVQSGAVADVPDGLGAGRTAAEITTGDDGVAGCFWRLGATEPVQMLRAELLLTPPAVSQQPARFTFTANLRTEIGDRPGLHVVQVAMRAVNQPLLNDSFVLPSELVEGVEVRLDAPLNEAMVNDKPVLTLTLDLPFPLSSLDQELWGEGLIGTTPLTLAGSITASKEAVFWTPTNPIQVFLAQRLFAVLEQQKRADRVLCHLTLTGRAIADGSGRDQAVLNGLTLGRPRGDGGTDMPLPSIDDVHGADFTLWFWLVRNRVRLVVVPTRTGQLRLKTARDALTLALPRTALQATLPAGVQVTPGDPDPDAARTAANRAFRGRPDRHLVLVVDERYAAAAAVIADALSSLDLTVDLIPTADPAAVTRARLDTGEPLDGVLTDDASAAPVAELTGSEEVAL